MKRIKKNTLKKKKTKKTKKKKQSKIVYKIYGDGLKYMIFDGKKNVFRYIHTDH
tara:strand:+ start:251 stop:412 length:162 start_codon:yes stop_codon:yes gene_type:complete